ncbi:MAG: efflux RND transporter periplasmic adaptor subunit [Planctomycetota bacterium]
MKELRPKKFAGLANMKVTLMVFGAFLAGCAVGALVGWAQNTTPIATARDQNADQTIIWTCSMHPNIRQPKPGQCRICLMDLIPVSSGPADMGERQISFSEAAIKLMEIETAPVERKFVTAEIRMVGKVDYDETRVKYITAWVPGRIDRLYVDYTGITVNKGDHVVSLYSSHLLTDQKALLEAVERAKNVKPDSSDPADRFKLRNVESARSRLRLLGLTEQQIADIEKAGKPLEHITIYAPIGGVVIHKNAVEQMYVDTGTKIYTIADLSQLWVKLDAYESDMMWVRYGQQVEFETEAHPGETFKGRITFIDPVLDPKTRTVKLRVNVDNLEGKLKPDMFVRAVVRANVAAGGRVMDEAMAGKWVCPMHPDVVKDGAGICDICEMDLKTAESLGYVKIDDTAEAPLVIPATAPLITGTRAVVYVSVPQVEKPTYEGREVVLGPRAGDYYIVNSGLAEGEVVVTNGNFKIDSAMQIQAKPSMMSPAVEKPAFTAEGKALVSRAAEQAICPVMGGKIDKNIFTEYKGKKVYFCCPACKPEFEKTPEKYLDKLPQFKE